MSLHNNKFIQPSSNDLFLKQLNNLDIVSENINDSIYINRCRIYLEKTLYQELSGPPTMSIATIIKGNGIMSIKGGQEMAINAGMTLLYFSHQHSSGYNFFQKGELHIIDLRFSFNELSKYDFHINNKFINQFEENTSHNNTIMLATKTTPQMLQIIHQIDHCSYTNHARTLFLTAKSLELLSLIILKQQNQTTATISCNRLHHKAIITAVKLLNECCEQNWTIKSLAKAVGINERKLKEGFKIVTQHTFHQYLELVRMHRSIQLLEQGFNVTNVALDVGYTSPSHFAKRFRLHYGVSPKKWSLNL